MGTANFCHYDAHNYHIVNFDIDDYKKDYPEYADYEDVLCDMINSDYDEQMEYVENELKRIVGEGVFKKCEYYKANETPIDFNRSYGAYYMGSICKRITDNYEVRIHCIATSGYYSGMNFDYVIEIQHEYKDGNYYESENLLSEDFELVKNKNVLKRAYALGKKIEKHVYEKSSEKYVCGGHFSNGEAIYCKVK
ncbi:MAG: hypothetical protein J5588_02440 [Bacteroidales bacterium]|nr:hypothetical protein [Bacteroidales bacterium]